MDDIIRRIIRWKERAKWSVRHDHSDDGLARILQEGVNLGHTLEDEWLKEPKPLPIDLAKSTHKWFPPVEYDKPVTNERWPGAAPTGGSHERYKTTLDG